MVEINPDPPNVMGAAPLSNHGIAKAKITNRTHSTSHRIDYVSESSIVFAAIQQVHRYAVQVNMRIDDAT
jgi:hypothetical protein